MIKDLPIVYFDFDEYSELSMISGVEIPAIEQDFIFYSEYMELKMSNDEKRIITGPAMLVDKPIYRKINGYEFYSCYSADTIRKASEYFMKNSINLKFNIDHDYLVDNVFGVESWIVEDVNYDKSKALGFKDINIGDWYVSYKVLDDNIWGKIKSGEINGFSVEIKAKVDEIIEINKFNKMNSILKSSLTKKEKIILLKSIFSF
jgi:hypothetical protein